MRRRNSRFTISLAFVVLAVLTLSPLAVATGPEGDSYLRVLRRNSWNDGLNAAGMRQDTVSRSRAELGASAGGGDFRNTYEPEKWREAGASAGTVRHLDKFSMNGTFSFRQTEAYGACGSMLMEPGFYPLDVMEFTPGRKTFQHYSFIGGLSVDLGPNWRIGGAMDYSSRNAAKRKDLRYSAYRLDMSVLPAALYHEGDLALGAVLVYGRNTETVSAEQIGSAASNPSAFFDEGAMYGNYEVWTGSGTHLHESGVSGLPFVENTGGLAFQASKGAWYGDISLITGKLRVGEKQTVWYRSPSVALEGRLTYRMPTAGAENCFRLHGSWKKQDVQRTVLVRETVGGVSLVKERGANNVQIRNLAAADFEYERLGRLWDFRAGLSWNMDAVSVAPVYPHLYGRTVQRFALQLLALRRLGRVSVWLAPSALTGSVKETEEVAAGVTVASGAPYRLNKNDYYYICNEFDSAFRTAVQAGCRVELGRGLFAGAEASCTKAFGLEHIAGDMRWSAEIKLGYDF